MVKRQFGTMSILLNPVVSSLQGPKTSLARVITHEIILKQVFHE